jgi:hypothetical protein
MSNEPLESINPVKPPTVNKNKKPMAQTRGERKLNFPYQRVDSQLNILIPVGIAIIMVALVK